MELVLIYSLCTTTLLVLIYVTTVFVLAQLLSDNSIMDISYGPAFAVATWGLIFIGQYYALSSILAGCIVTLWSLRLSLRILRKNWGAPEDARYRTWREEWMKQGTVYFILRSYIQIYLLQGVIIVLVSMPLIIAVVAHQVTLSLLSYLGLGIALFGLTYETIADWQLDRFITQKKKGETSATLMTSGLFRYSRRPNYFGESLVWVGLAVMVLPFPYGYLGLVSPLVITYIVTNITGPMLENIFLEKYPVEYRAYMANTNYFIPGPPKKYES